jgi:thiamine biosynthesis protein ThiS
MTDKPEITCRINGKDETLPDGTTLIDFLAMKNVPAKAVVIEYNRNVLPRGKYDGISLCHGDTLEIVQVIGGG